MNELLDVHGTKPTVLMAVRTTNILVKHSMIPMEVRVLGTLFIEIVPRSILPTNQHANPTLVAHGLTTPARPTTVMSLHVWLMVAITTVERLIVWVCVLGHTKTDTHVMGHILLVTVQVQEVLALVRQVVLVLMTPPTADMKQVVRGQQGCL